MHILDDSEIEKTFVERDHVLPDIPSSPSAPSPARPLIGQTRIGFGLVVDAIGAGGTASVYKVWNERLELFRAVKMLSLDAPHARFETEAKITAKLRHPHIVEVYSVGEWNNVPYMEMEYVDGCNMQEALEARGRFPDAVCCAAGLFIAGALDYAHTLKFTLGGNSYDGIIHRDLKPANILISKRSEIKLTDFGIARPAQAGLHTIDGNIVGTLRYLSPEQMGDGEIDQCSDIYSLGTILYEMATGAKAFPQKNIAELTTRRAANSFKPLDEYDTPVTPALSNIILKCLKASPQERYRGAAELIGDLQKAYAEIAPKSAPQKTLYEFFSEDKEDAGVTPTAFMIADVDAGTNVVSTDTDVNADTDDGINVNTSVNTDINTIDIDQPSVKIPVKRPPTKRTVAYAAAALIAILSVSYITVRLFSGPSPKHVNKHTVAAADFFSAPVNTDTAAATTPDTLPPADTSVSVSMAPVNNTKASMAVNTTDTNTASVDTADVNTAAINTDSVNTANINPKNAPPAAPAVSENALIKSAADAIGKKEWDRAIRILEKNAAFTEKRGERHLLLFEAYVESRQLDKAKTLLDGAAKTNDALYFLTAGRYHFYRNDHHAALTALEASLTRSSSLRNRNAILCDAQYYIALIRSARFKASPTETTRKQAQEAWKRVKSAYESNPESPQFRRAEEEILELY